MLAWGLEFYSRPDGFLASVLLATLCCDEHHEQISPERRGFIPSYRRAVKEGIHSRSWKAETTELCSPRLAPLAYPAASYQLRTTRIVLPTVGWVFLHQSSIKTYALIKLMELSPPLRALLPSWVKLTTHAYADSILHGKAPAISRKEWPAKESMQPLWVLGAFIFPAITLFLLLELKTR